MIASERGYVRCVKYLLQLQAARCKEATFAQEASGLKWTVVGDTELAGGEVLTNDALSEALTGKTEFTQQEWEAFGIQDLSVKHFITAGDKYFKPEGHTALSLAVRGHRRTVAQLLMNEYVEPREDLLQQVSPPQS